MGTKYAPMAWGGQGAAATMRGRRAQSGWVPVDAGTVHVSDASEGSQPTFALTSPLTAPAVALVSVTCGESGDGRRLKVQRAASSGRMLDDSACSQPPRWWASTTDASPGPGRPSVAAWDGGAEALPESCVATTSARVLLQPRATVYVAVARGSSPTSAAPAPGSPAASSSFSIRFDVVEVLSPAAAADATSGVAQFGNDTAGGILHRAVPFPSASASELLRLRISAGDTDAWSIWVGNADTDPFPSSQSHSLQLSGTGPGEKDLSMSAAVGNCTPAGEAVFVLGFKSATAAMVKVMASRLVRGAQAAPTVATTPLTVEYATTDLDALPGDTVLVLGSAVSDATCSNGVASAYPTAGVVDARAAGSAAAVERPIQCRTDGSPAPEGAWALVLAAPDAAAGVADASTTFLVSNEFRSSSSPPSNFVVWATRVLALDPGSGVTVPASHHRGNTAGVALRVIAPPQAAGGYAVPQLARVMVTVDATILQATTASVVAWDDSGTFARRVHTPASTAVYLSEVGPAFAGLSGHPQGSTDDPTGVFSAVDGVPLTVLPDDADAGFDVTAALFNMFGRGESSAVSVPLPSHLTPQLMAPGAVHISASPSGNDGAVVLQWWQEGDPTPHTVAGATEATFLLLHAPPSDGVQLNPPKLDVSRRLFISVAADPSSPGATSASISVEHTVTLQPNDAWSDPALSVMPALPQCFAVPLDPAAPYAVGSARAVVVGLAAPSAAAQHAPLSLLTVTGKWVEGASPNDVQHCPSSTEGTELPLTDASNAVAALPQLATSGSFFLSAHITNPTDSSQQVALSAVTVTAALSVFPDASPVLRCEYLGRDGVLGAVLSPPTDEQHWEVVVIPANAAAAASASRDGATGLAHVGVASRLAWSSPESDDDGDASVFTLVGDDVVWAAPEQPTGAGGYASLATMRFVQPAGTTWYMTVESCEGDVALLSRRASGSDGLPDLIALPLTWADPSAPISAPPGERAATFTFTVPGACLNRPLEVTLSPCAADSAVVWISEGVEAAVPHYGCSIVTSSPFTAQAGEVAIDTLQELNDTTITVACVPPDAPPGSEGSLPGVDDSDEAALITAGAAGGALLTISAMALRHLRARRECCWADRPPRQPPTRKGRRASSAVYQRVSAGEPDFDDAHLELGKVS